MNEKKDTRMLGQYVILNCRSCQDGKMPPKSEWHTVGEDCFVCSGVGKLKIHIDKVNEYR